MNLEYTLADFALSINLWYFPGDRGKLKKTSNKISKFKRVFLGLFKFFFQNQMKKNYI